MPKYLLFSNVYAMLALTVFPLKIQIPERTDLRFFMLLVVHTTVLILRPDIFYHEN